MSKKSLPWWTDCRCLQRAPFEENILLHSSHGKVIPVGTRTNENKSSHIFWVPHMPKVDWKQILSQIMKRSYVLTQKQKKQLTYSMKKKSIGTSKPSEILLNIQCLAVYLNQLNNVNQIWIFILKSHYRETTKWYFNQSYLDEQQ